MSKIHRGWYVCAGTTIMFFATTGILANAFTVFQPYIIKQNNFTNTQGSALLMLRNFMSLVLMFFIIKLYDKITLRTGMTASVLISALCCLLYSQAQSFYVYCFAALLAGAACTLGGMLPASVLLVKWFNSHRALVIGICSAGSGVASIVMPAILTNIVETYSLSAALLTLTVLEIVLAVLVYLLICNSPEEVHLTPVSDAKPLDEALPGKDNAIDVAADYAHFKIMLLAIFLVGTTNSSAYCHIAVLYKTEGFTAMTIALGLSIIGVTLTIGKCLYGEVADRIGTYRANWIFFSLFILGLFLAALAFIPSTLLFLTSMALMGIGFGITTLGTSLWAGDLSTVQSYGNTLRKFQIASWVGSFSCSMLPGVIADICGSYVPAYFGLVVFTIIGFLLIQKTYKHYGLVR